MGCLDLWKKKKKINDSDNDNDNDLLWSCNVYILHCIYCIHVPTYIIQASLASMQASKSGRVEKKGEGLRQGVAHFQNNPPPGHKERRLEQRIITAKK